MAVTPFDRRRSYQREVLALRLLAERLTREGQGEEAVARALVAARNALKVRFRALDDPALVALMEARNRAKYGDPLGPSADALLVRYGDWQRVIEAACRPARLID
ncbi:hypothetical protein AB5I41_25620 [Sphingomonas sp. MMS24-JH45]